MNERIRVGAIHGGPGYYPAFVAEELGFFSDEGLSVDFSSPGYGPWIARAVLSGEAEVALGGLWRPMMYRERIGVLTGFVQLNSRCYMRLVSRNAKASALKDVVGRSVLVPGGAPSGWLYMVGLLGEAGIDASQVRFIRDFSAPEAIDLFRGGLGDFILLTPGPAEALVISGGGHFAYSLSDGGLCPWSVYYAAPAFLSLDGGEIAGRFAAAIQRALRWVLNNPASAGFDIFKKRYPGLAPETVASAVEGCIERHVWSPSVRIPDDSLMHWQEMVLRAGLIDRALPYSEIFDDRPSVWAEEHSSSRSG